MHKWDRFLQAVRFHGDPGAGNTGIHRRRGQRTHHISQPPCAQLYQMLGQLVATGKVVHPDEIKIAATGERPDIAIQQHHRNARLPQQTAHEVGVRLVPLEEEGALGQQAFIDADDLVVEGAGKDTQNLGKDIQNSADKNK